MKVAVIGAGVVGITTAYELAMQGHEVKVFERNSSVAQECSFANAGVISPGYVTPWAKPGMAWYVLSQLGRKNAPVRISGLGFAEMAWLSKWWRACDSKTFNRNRKNLLDLSLYSQERLQEITKRLHLAYDRSQGYMVLMRDERERKLLQPSIELMRAEGLDLKVQIGIVIGGGNIFRGVALGAAGMDRATADYMGMMATVMNALALQDAMKHAGIIARVQSALNIEQVAEPYIRGKAIRYLEEGKVVIFAAGTGNPFFTTDTAAALRGVEMNADIMIKATKVDGIYSEDPKKNPKAKRYEVVSFDEAIQKDLKVMDATALTLCRDQQLPIAVFNIFKSGALKSILLGQNEGTLVMPNVH